MMKVYQSPLSIFGLFLLSLSTAFIIRLVTGEPWRGHEFLLASLLGMAIFLFDQFFISRSEVLSFKEKLLIQSLTVFAFFLGFSFFYFIK